MPPATLRSPEPIAGYTLRQRIGAGGYGEVWKADAPGGLVKAIKFVFGCLDEQRAACEMKALGRIKEVRHPFLLSLERIEVVDGQLVIITELADQSVKDRFEECKKQGLPGIPRDDLLVYLRDAADALDYMSEHYSLQHLDVKPENLLLVGGRVKVADFGLVKDIHDATVSLMGGLTPVYASPEVYEGRPSLHSDQYSLAIVYQEMLTGVLPFPGRTPAQLAAQHLNARPRLGSLPEDDRPVIARALAKDPAERHPSCRMLIETLLNRGVPPERAGGRGRPAGGGETKDVKDQATRSAAPGRERPDPDAVSTGPRRPAPQAPATKTFALGDEAIRAGVAALVPRPEPPAEPSSLDGEHEFSPTQTYRGPAESGPRGGASPAQAARAAAASAELARGPSPLEIRDLGPVDVGPRDARFRPTLVIGIGAVAARVLRQFRGRLHDRFGSADALGAVRTLLIDTDSRTCAQATHGDETTALRHADTIAVPLRAAQEYRTDSGKLLHWLSRRWLFNIPRSLQTEGIRPLGRLALVDHYATVAKRLREVLKEMGGADVLAASAQAAGMEPGQGLPQVFLVASICGGTGSGMVLDAAYAVRDALTDLGHDEDGLSLYGLLVHATGSGPGGKQVAAANACAALAELNHYSVAGYPGDPACGLPPLPAGTGPFTETYLTSWGDELSDSQIDAAVDQLAKYVFLNVATTASAFFAKCRQADGDSRRPEEPVLRLRTFGLRQVGSPQSGVLGPAVQLVCKGVIERWLGRAPARRAPEPASAPPASADDAELEQQAQKSGVGEGPFLEIAREVVAVQLGQETEPFLRGLFDQVLGQRQAGVAAPWTVGLLTTINAVLGTAAEGDDAVPAKESVRTSIEEPIRRLASPRADVVCSWILKRVDEQGAGLARARQAAAWFAARLRAIEAELSASVLQLQKTLDHAQQVLVDAKSTDRAQLKAWLSLGRSRPAEPKLDERWIEFGRLRVEQVALGAAALFARAVRAQVSQVGDRLSDLHRELGHMASQFEVPPGWGQPRREVGPPPADAAIQEIARALRVRAADMAAALDAQMRQAWLVPHGGLCGLLKHGAALRPRLLRALRAEARTAVSRALTEIRVAGALAEAPGADESGPRPIGECFEESRPALLGACGGVRRVLVLCPDEALDTTHREIAATGITPGPTVLPDPCGDLLLCHEVHHVPLDLAAAALIDQRRDLAEMASRLHTRVDVSWRRLAGG